MTTSAPDFPAAWIEISEYTLDASKVVYQAEHYPVACDLAWGAAEKAVKAVIFSQTESDNFQDAKYKSHRISKLYSKIAGDDTLGVLDSVLEFGDYNEYVRYPKWEADAIEMPAEKYMEAKAEKALVSAGLILDAARDYVVD